MLSHFLLYFVLLPSRHSLTLLLLRVTHLFCCINHVGVLTTSPLIEGGVARSMRENVELQRKQRARALQREGGGENVRANGPLLQVRPEKWKIWGTVFSLNFLPQTPLQTAGEEIWLRPCLHAHDSVRVLYQLAESQRCGVHF